MTGPLLSAAPGAYVRSVSANAGPASPPDPDVPASYSSSGTSPLAQAFEHRLDDPPALLGSVAPDGQQGVTGQDALQDFAVGQQLGGAQLCDQSVARSRLKMSPGPLTSTSSSQRVRPEPDPELVGGVHAR